MNALFYMENVIFLVFPRYHSDWAYCMVNVSQENQKCELRTLDVSMLCYKRVQQFKTGLIQHYSQTFVSFRNPSKITFSTD